ncbi:MAG: hypothetical protein KME20_13800 [Kaiparowitsia implicata GSE-PSE-MK54-09C]|jgi:RecB family endonuclease NucS|nr:hypothetical protein [Kaiparowitsia implicata GSE-PSE-MK54-09C]
MSYPLFEAVKLKKVGSKWEFQSEVNLENFLYLCLDKMLGATPLKRQFLISGQFCDILAVEPDKRLLIIELKNKEDRYVVNQVSRYHSALLEEKPFTDFIDYSKPIKLLVISPAFHRDNLIDRKYSQLDIQFLKFDLSVESGHLIFILKDLESNEVASITVPYEKELQEQLISEPPRRLLTLLANIDEVERKAVLNSREQILRFHSQIKELFIGSSVLYGFSKTKTCAEIRYDKSRKTIALFLWLPHVTSSSTCARKIIARMRIWTNWSAVTALGHVPKGNGRMVSFEEWQSGSVRPLNKLLPSNSWGNSTEKYFTDKSYRERFVGRRRYLALNPHYKSGLAMSIERYLALIGREGEALSLEDLINLALETWLEKI